MADDQPQVLRVYRGGKYFVELNGGPDDTEVIGPYNTAEEADRVCWFVLDMVSKMGVDVVIVDGDKLN